MRVLLLTSKDDIYHAPIKILVESLGHEVKVETHPIDEEYLFALGGYDFLISYGYRHILGKRVLDCFEKTKRINLHISYLPYNRGASPNLWSWIDDTPKGVTIHCLDDGIDTGDILVQREVWFAPTYAHTLRTSYVELHKQMLRLFRENVEELLLGIISPQKQVGEGTYHNKAQTDLVMSSLSQKYDTPVSMLKDYHA